MRPADLDPDQCLILLREKGETVRWQPVSPTLMVRLIEHGRERHALPDGQLLRYASGRPITYRRYDHLWTRIGRQLPWVATQQISMHWIRHTTLTWVERNFGYAVAKAYAGHTDTGSEAGATATYVRATTHEVAATTGDDPELDTLILRLHTETACRRGGALALRPADLDRDQCLVLLREKGETVRWQPVSPTLMAALARHAEERHAPPDGRLLRYRDGRPVTYRRYDGLWERIGRHLRWVRTQQISTHWIRHTTLTWVERNFGFAVAHAYAGHTDGAGDTGTATSTYVRATLTEVATALTALTGEPHPLAEPEGRPA